MRLRNLILMLASLAIVCISPLQAQQKGQWVPGQMGLNAGVTPDPGFTYSNIAINYSANKLNDSNGNAVPGVTGTYGFWVDENVFAYVPKFKILGAKFVPMAILNFANGSLVADLSDRTRSRSEYRCRWIGNHRYLYSAGRLGLEVEAC
jgi:hypothetical protein